MSRRIEVTITTDEAASQVLENLRTIRLTRRQHLRIALTNLKRAITR